MQSKYKAVVIGCGNIGSRFSQNSKAEGVHSHAQAYTLHSKIDLVGVCDTNTEFLSDAEVLWKTSGFSNYQEMCLKLQPDIISLCTTNETHYEISKFILKNSPPKLLFIEKPIALNSKQGQEILDLAEDNHCAISVNYSRRFSKDFQNLYSDLKSGNYGKPVLAHFYYGKGLFHNGSHLLDLIRFLFGEPISILKRDSTWGPHGDETFSFDLTFIDNFKIHVDAFNEKIATVFEGDIFTEKARWRFSQGGQHWEHFILKESTVYKGYKNYLPSAINCTHPKEDQSLLNAIHNIVDHIDIGTPLLSSGQESLATLKLCEKIAQAN